MTEDSTPDTVNFSNIREALSKWEADPEAYERKLNKMKRVEFRTPEGINPHWFVYDPVTGAGTYGEEFHEAWRLNIQTVDMYEAAAKRTQQRRSGNTT